jgi:hypothetical protein
MGSDAPVRMAARYRGRIAADCGLLMISQAGNGADAEAEVSRFFPSRRR